MALCTCGLGAHQPSKLKFLLGRHLATNSFGLGRPLYKSSHQLQNFRCHRNQNGRNLDGFSLNFFCVRATKQPAMQVTFLLELFKNIKSLNHCIVLLSLYKFIKIIVFLLFQQQYKESSVYLVRFKQCLNQALNQVKSHVVSLLKNATAQVLANKVS